MPLPLVCLDGLKIAFPKCMPEEAMPEEAIPEQAKKSGRSLRGQLVFAVPVVILVAIGIWFWASRGDDAAVQANAEQRVRSTLHLETFVLNLADPDQRAYLRVGIDLGLNKEMKAGEEPAPIPQIRDTILGVLAQAKGDELVTAQGKTKLKQDLLRALQERVPQLGAEEIYFTEFLIQR